MSVKEGQRVRVVSREVTAEDRTLNRYFSHMAGLTGTVQNVYGKDQIAIKVDPESLDKTSAEVHREAVRRMREKFLASISEEQKTKLTPEEQNFDAHYMLLAREADLEQI